jgi:hypothetical protein
MSTEQVDFTPEQQQIAEQMDKATQELTSFIQYLCDKYGAEFIVQKVMFTFVPKPESFAPAVTETGEITTEVHTLNEE